MVHSAVGNADDQSGMDIGDVTIRRIANDTRTCSCCSCKFTCNVEVLDSGFVSITKEASFSGTCCHEVSKGVSLSVKYAREGYRIADADRCSPRHSKFDVISKHCVEVGMSCLNHCSEPNELPFVANLVEALSICSHVVFLGCRTVRA